MDANLKFDPNQQQLVVYRQLRIRDDVLSEEARVLTDAFVDHDIRLVNQDGKANINDPILKRDLYALLMIFLEKQPLTQPIKQPRSMWQYSDLFGYDHYKAIFSLFPQWLPRPIHQKFYPNAYVTREEFLNLMLLIKGVPMQVATTMHVATDLPVFSSLEGLVPSHWSKDPLAYVSKRDVIQLFGKVLPLPVMSTGTPLAFRVNQSGEVPLKQQLSKLSNQASRG